MRRILHTIDTTGPGGAETVFVNLIKGLDCKKFEPVVAIRGPGWVCDELKKNGINPLFVNSKGALSIQYLFGLIRIIRENKIDLIQSHLLGTNLYCSLAGMVCGVPVVSTFHGFVDMNAKERFSAIKSRLINRGSERIVFVSKTLKDFYVERKGFSARKSVTIYNGVDTAIFKPQRDDSIRRKLGLGTDNILVGAVGNIRPSKGYEYLLEAARLVIDQCPQFRFAVAGEGTGVLYEDLLDLRKKLGLENCFFFLGFDPDVPKFLNNLDIFVLPSITEGFSISTIEAMACGVPAIATRSGGPEEIISHLENGILVVASSPEEMSDTMVQLSKDSNLSKDIRTNAYKYVVNNYSIGTMIYSYEKEYCGIKK